MISVCIPTFNGEKYIFKQISSILPQLGLDDEIVISDDGSTDNTLDIIKSFKDTRIKLFDNKCIRKRERYNFMYVTKNIENALSNAVGEIIFLADQDDIWHHEKVNISLKYLENCDLVLSDCKIIDGEDSVIYNSYFEINNSKKGILSNLIKNSYLGCCMAFRSSIMKVALPIGRSVVPHDIWFGLLAETFFKVEFIDDTLVYYRRHENNLSPSAGKSANSSFFKIMYRLSIAKALVKRIILSKT